MTLICLALIPMLLNACLCDWLTADLTFSNAAPIASAGATFTGTNTSSSSLHTTLRFSGDLTEANTATFASEARFRVDGTHEYQVTTATSFTGTTSVNSVTQGVYWAPQTQGAVTVETFEQTDDGNDDVADASWSNVDFELEGTPVVIDIGDLNLAMDFVFDTEGSEISDSEIAAYNLDGTLIAEDDDAGSGSLSRLDLGSLSAGTYYIVAGDFDLTFANFQATTNGTDTGDLALNLNGENVHIEELSSGEIVVVRFNVVAVPEPTSTAIFMIVSFSLLLVRTRA